MLLGVTVTKSVAVTKYPKWANTGRREGKQPAGLLSLGELLQASVKMKRFWKLLGS